MRGKIAKKIDKLVPDTIATGREAKKKAWNKLNWKERSNLSSASKKGND
jgi:hypothetical protein